MSPRRWIPVLALALLFPMAACTGNQPDDYTAPGAVPPGPAAPQPTTPVGPAVPPSPGRPMTAWEKQYYQQCQTNVVHNGCELFTDYSLRLQGIDPDS